MNMNQESLSGPQLPSIIFMGKSKYGVSRALPTLV
jgi:hypothetical protein